MADVIGGDEFILWGYHVTKDSPDAVCLLVNPDVYQQQQQQDVVQTEVCQQQLFCMRRCRQQVKKNRHNNNIYNGRRRQNNFRRNFPDMDPPDPFTRVVEHVFSLEKKMTDTATPIKGLESDWEHTLLTEQDIDTFIFKDVQQEMRKVCNTDMNMFDMKQERDFVLYTAFKPHFIRQIRQNLTEFFASTSTVCTVHTYYGGKKRVVAELPGIGLRGLFVAFEPVDKHGTTDRYPHGADYVMMRHKIIKYVYEDMCPFARVALGDTLQMEIALSRCLPMGSSNRGTEIFCDDHDDTDDELDNTYYYVSSSQIVFRASDFKMINPMATTNSMSETPNVKTIVELPEGLSFFDWLEYDVITGRLVNNKDDTEKPPEFFSNPERQMALIASVYKVDETDRFFDDQAVVFTTNQDAFSCVDFSNFYASVAIKFDIDPYVSRVLRKMTELRESVPDLKQWIVTLIGKSKHYSPTFYNKVKPLSVATVVSTIEANSSCVVGATTDGILINAEKLQDCPSLRVPSGFPIKTEFIPSSDRPMLVKNPSTYVGFRDDNTRSIVHRGFIGRTGVPMFYRDLLDVVLTACMEAEYGFGDSKRALDDIRDDMIGRLNAVMTTKRPIDFVLPDTRASVSCVMDERSVLEYVINDMNVGNDQFYAVIDDHILQRQYLCTEHVLPVTLSGYCIKQIDVRRYVDVLKDKLRRVARDLRPAMSTDETDSTTITSAIQLCKIAHKLLADHIQQILPSARGAYPGGVCV